MNDVTCIFTGIYDILDNGNVRYQGRLTVIAPEYQSHLVDIDARNYTAFMDAIQTFVLDKLDTDIDNVRTYFCGDHLYRLGEWAFDGTHVNISA